MHATTTTTRSAICAKAEERVYVDARRGCLSKHKQRNLVIDVHASMKRHRRNDQLFPPPSLPPSPLSLLRQPDSLSFALD